MTKPNVSILFTGGTISMTHSAPDGSAVPTLKAADIAQAVPGLDASFDLHCSNFLQLPGPHITLEHMVELAREAQRAFDAGASGVVITHGTDTLEESAFALDLLLPGDKPVVFVGAMRTRDELSWDGPVNLMAACQVASHAKAAGRGVLVVMNNTINAASEVTKSFTEAVDTFVCPDMGPIGIVDVGRVLFFRHPVRRSRLPFPSSLPRVEVVMATAGDDGFLIDAACDRGASGLVVSAMGRGNTTPGMAAAIERARRRGVSVVLCSRCWGGRVAPAYGYVGGGARLLEAGVIFAPWLNAPKARIALCLALGAGLHEHELQALFDSPTSQKNVCVKNIV